MGLQIECNCHHPLMIKSSSSSSLSPLSFSSNFLFSTNIINYKTDKQNKVIVLRRNQRIQKRSAAVVVYGSSNVAAPPLSDDWLPEKNTAAPSLSDVFWPSAGAFAAMAILGKIDQMLAPKGISMTIAPLGAVCAVLFASPSSPAARKYNMFMAQIGCAATGVLAFSVFGPGWLARSTALAASIAFMIYTRSSHPPAASLPILFIDGAKLHHLHIWYALFPGATACILLCMIQEIVCYLKNKFRF